MQKLLLFTAAALGAPLLAGSTAGLELRFQVEDGSSLTTTATRVLTLELSDSEMAMVFDGEEHGGESPEIELTMTESERIVFTDEYSGVSGGRAARIERSFEEIGTTSLQDVVDPDGEEFEDETPGTSALESTLVVFTWDADDEEYSAAFGEDVEDVDEDLLEGLDAVADYSWFLPEDEVEEGDTWEIDLDAFKRTSSISGELSVVREGEEDDPEDDFGEQFDDNLAGAIEGEFMGLREVDGVELAVLHIRAELDTEIEQSEDIEQDGGEGSSTDTYEFEFELEGDLLWDVEGGHAHSFVFSGDCSMTLSQEQEFAGDGHEISVSTVQEFEGTIEYEVTIE